MNGREAMIQRIKDEAADHPAECDCTTCRAAAGDEDARSELLRELL